MSDIGDDFKALKEISDRKKAKNLVSSEQLLINNNVKYKKFTDYHFRLLDYPYDFYSSTGVYINTKTKQQGRGVFNLLKVIGR